MDRRRNIDQINSKYAGSAHEGVSSTVTPLHTFVGGTTAIRRSRIATSTIGGSVLSPNQIAGGRVVTSTIGSPALRVSAIR